VPLTYVTQQVEALYPHHNPRIHAQITKPVKAREFREIVATSILATESEIEQKQETHNVKESIYNQIVFRQSWPTTVVKHWINCKKNILT